MKATIPSSAEERRDEIAALIEERAVLKGWLARLPEYGSQAPAHVVERVRDDYLERLQRTTERLTPHLEGLRQDLELLRGEWEVAQSQHAAAVDALEEARLRQLIGEISADAWSEQEPELSEAVAEAAAEKDRLEAEVARIAAVVAEIEGELAPAPLPENELAADATEADPVEADPAAAGEASAPGESAGGVEEGFADEPTLEGGRLGEPQELQAEAAGEASGELEEADLLDWLAEEAEEELGSGEDEEQEGDEGQTFLEHLDRAIAAAGDGADGSAAHARGNGPAASATAREVRYCRACGSDNDIRAWYCEICGEELS